MALQLMDPVYKEMPLFQPNQVLTYEHLNDLAGYLSQQERYTRNKLIGNGIVCGLSFTWVPLVAPRAKVIIDDGLGITSAGYLAIYKSPGDLTHKIEFTRLKKYAPFDDATIYTNEKIYELVTLADFNADEETIDKDFLFDNDKNNRVLIILLEPEVKNPAKCLDENCDDKGKVYLYTPRPLLVPIAVLDRILDSVNAKYLTEEGRGWRGIDSKLNKPLVSYASVPNLFKNFEFATINSAAGILSLFKNRLQDADLDTIKDRIDALLNSFPWVFTTGMNAVKAAEMGALTPSPASNLGTLFKNKAKNFRDTAANNNYMQYLYDFVRDVVDAYNELYTHTTDLVSECGGNENPNPYHVMLGKTQANDEPLPYYEEGKYLNPVAKNFRYRHYFVSSPVMGIQFMLYEKIQQLLKRLARLVNNFSVNAGDVTIKVTPSVDYDNSISLRSVPYYYTPAGATALRRVWNYESTKRNRTAIHLGYQLAPNTQDDLLVNDTSKNDFYRIEGHAGTAAGAALTSIDTIRKKYNLPFTVASVSVQSSGSSLNSTCTFPDLEEEYNYYRDRVLGYLRFYIDWLQPKKGAIFKEILKLIKSMMNLLLERRCIEAFNYNQYKKIYARIYEVILEYYATFIPSNTSLANHAFNSLQNVLNIIFFRPIYKIWYMYKYRIGLIAASHIDSLTELADKYTGLEHLAGVRRGETFLLVYDTAQANKIIADFNIPDLISCTCDCKAPVCNNNHKSKVSPLQKPIIMVVDLNSNDEDTKSKAAYVPADDLYRLKLDSMGFYKADSDIDKSVFISEDENGNDEFTALKGYWVTGNKGEFLYLDFPRGNKNIKFGIFQLYYHMKGDFDENNVTGMLLLVVIGEGKFEPGAKVNINKGAVGRGVYTYDKKEYANKNDIKIHWPDKYQVVAIGKEKVPVYTTEAGNEIGIFKDKGGYPYFKVVKSDFPVAEEVPYVIEANGNSVKTSLVLNVIDKADKPEQPEYNGRVMDAKGSPVANAKVTTDTGKEVYTNEKGEFKLTNLKGGEVIGVEKSGLKTNPVQVNSKTPVEITMSAKTINIPGVGAKLPGGLDELVKSVDLSNLKNIFNK